MARQSRESEPVGAGSALFRLIRFWARRWPQKVAQETRGASRDVQRIVVVDTIAAARENQIVDVRAVAEALGVDRSVASRMISDVTQAGLVDRGTAAYDSRHSDLRLTDAGEELLAAARQWQESVFLRYTDGWPQSEREEFARLLIKFTAAATQ